jgi:hypothetical protein
MNPMRDPFDVVLLVLDRVPPQGEFLSGPSEDSEEERHRSVYAQARVSSTSRNTISQQALACLSLLELVTALQGS